MARMSRPDASLLPGAGWLEGQVGWPAVAGPGVAVDGGGRFGSCPLPAVVLL